MSSTAVPYIWVPILAVFFYSFLLIAFCSAKKSKLIYSFMWYMFVSLLWTGGSMLMRMQFSPGYEFWYQVSIIAVFAIPYAFYNFVYCYLHGNNRIEHISMELFTLAIMILTYFQVFLPIPVMHVAASGKTTFIYYAGWRLVFPTLLAVILVGLSLKRVANAVKVKHQMVSEVYLPLLGAAFLIVGNIMSVLPGVQFPFDTFSGIINAFLVFFTLTRKRAFKLNLLVSPYVVLYCTLIVGAVLGANFIGDGIKLIQGFTDSITAVIVIMSVALTVFVLLVGLLAYKAINRISLRREQVVQDRVKNFSLATSKTLNVHEIMGDISDVLCEGLGISHLMIFMLDRDKGKYVLSHTVNPLDNKNIEIDRDVPYIEYIKDSDTCLLLNEFKRSTTYRSMWESEKRMLADCDVACITPIRNNKDLTGILLIGNKSNMAPYSYDDIVFLESIQSIGSIALNNAMLFEETKRRADMDDLTGMLNRNAFLKRVDDIIAAQENDQLSLIMISIDDFRLYNELYGSQEGDKALQYIASMIMNTVTRNDIAGRYSGKEFCICLPGKNQMQALRTTESIKEQLNRNELGKGGMKMKKLTFCAGICSIPYGASNLKELLTNATMQVFSGKHSGKDKIITYQSDGVSGRYGAEDGDGQQGQIVFHGYEGAASTIYALTAAIDAKDHYTFNHSSNVAEYASELAKEAGLSDEHIRIIHEAGLLHDVGKIAIPESILSKPGRLEPDEYEIMKTHVEHSIEIIRYLPDLDYLIPAVVGHHERWDGTGYPNGIEGDNIPMGARCLAVADAFDAMTSKRSYKEAFSVEFAAKEIKNQAGKQFDPQLACLFVDMIEDGQIRPRLRDAVG